VYGGGDAGYAAGTLVAAGYAVTGCADPGAGIGYPGGGGGGYGAPATGGVMGIYPPETPAPALADVAVLRTVIRPLNL
jgi:hypothetical protein